MERTYTFNTFLQTGTLRETVWQTMDLHLHTYYSDGLVEPRYYLQHSLTQHPCSYISITDHNSVQAYLTNDFIQEATLAPVTCIPGVEIDCRSSMDILVYAKESSVEKAFLEEVQHIIAPENLFRRQCVKEYVRALEKYIHQNKAPEWFSSERFEEHIRDLLEGEQVATIDFRSHTFTTPKRDFVGKKHILHTLIGLGIIVPEKVVSNSVKECYKTIKRWLFEQTLQWIPDRLPINMNLIAQIAQMQYGTGVIAHPGRTIAELQKLAIPQHISFDSLQEMLDGLTACGLLGIEVDYRAYAPSKAHYAQEVRVYVEHRLIKGDKLYLTGGSDYHG